MAFHCPAKFKAYRHLLSVCTCFSVLNFQHLYHEPILKLSSLFYNIIMSPPSVSDS